MQDILGGIKGSHKQYLAGYSGRNKGKPQTISCRIFWEE
jgi:hypothetical protein